MQAEILPIPHQIIDFGIFFDDYFVYYRDALELYTSKARAVANLSPTLIRDSEESTFFILRNSDSEFFTHLNKSCTYFELDVRESILLFETWMISLVVCSILLVLIVLLFAVRPTIWLIEGNLMHYILFLFR